MRLTGGRLNSILITNYRWRAIGETRAGPRLREAGKRSHIFSARSMTPEHQMAFGRMSYREKHMLALPGSKRAHSGF